MENVNDTSVMPEGEDRRKKVLEMSEEDIRRMNSTMMAYAGPAQINPALMTSIVSAYAGPDMRQQPVMMMQGVYAGPSILYNMMQDNGPEIGSAIQAGMILAGLYCFCPGCGEKAKAEKFCRQCGTPLKEVKMYRDCPDCGTRLDAGDKFCGNCGKKLDPQETLMA